MGPHLSAEQLAAAIRGDGRAEEDQHLATCAACRLDLEERRRDEALFEELSRTVQTSGVAVSCLLTRHGIPGYELLGEIGVGGQGAVYLACQDSTGRKVALKVISGRGRAKDRIRFEREVALASRLEHPGIVRVYEAGEENGRLWYAMELAEGERLEAYLRNTVPDETARLDLFELIAEAVAYAHRCGVIHRDLKPANVLVDSGGTPRIVDFGLAFAFDAGAAPRLTATGEFLGTLEYASPEQAEGQSVDTRTDVHALGLLLHEILTGELPWPSTAGVRELLDRVIRQEPEEPTGIGPELWTVLRTALAKDPDHRYASADALLADLRRCRAFEPLEARRHSTAYVLRLAFARHRKKIGVMAVVLAFTLVGLGLFLREQWRAESRNREAMLAQRLMRDIVGVGSPMHSEAERLDVLEESLARLDAESEGAHDVRAALLLALGESHAARLREVEAEKYLRSAIERFRAGSDREGEMRALAALARVLAIRGADEAVEAAEVVVRYRESHDEGGLELAAARRLLARALLDRLPPREDDREQAALALSQAFDAQLAVVGAEHPEVAATQTLLARVAGSADEAVGLYEKALTILERRPGQVRRTIECLDGYAGLLLSLGNHKEADSTIERSARLTRQTFGDRHTVEHLRRRALIENELGNPATAERLAREALVTELQDWAERRPGQVGLELLEGIRSSEAPPYVESFELLRTLRGSGDFALSSWMNDIASFLLALERPNEAEALLREALNIYCRVYGQDCPNRMRTLMVLADQVAGQGRREESIAMLDEVIERCEKRGSEGDMVRLDALAARRRISSAVDR